MKQLLSLFIFALLLVNTAWADKEPKQYQIELIVYSQITPQAVQSEQWPPIAGFQLPSTPTIDLKQQQLLLPKSAFKLKAVQAEINRNPAFKTLMHIAWRQAVLPPKKAIPIHLTGGQYFESDGDTANTGAPDANTDGLTPQIDGLLSINLKRYFNVTFNLVFSAPMKQISALSKDDHFSSVDNGLMHFHLLQSRRMRSNELNYIDYPLYGIIIEIFPT